MSGWTIPLEAVQQQRQPFDLMGNYARAVQLRDIIQEADARQAERDRLAREDQERQRLGNAIVLTPEGQIDRPNTAIRARDMLGEGMIRPDTYMGAIEGWDAADRQKQIDEFALSEAERKQRMGKLDAADQELKLFGQLAGAVTDPPSYRRFLQQAVENELLTQEEADEYPEFDTRAQARLQQLRDQALSLGEQSAAHRQSILDERADQEARLRSLDNQRTIALQYGGTPEGRLMLQDVLDPEVFAAMPADAEAFDQWALSPEDRINMRQPETLPVTEPGLTAIAYDPAQPEERRQAARAALADLRGGGVNAQPGLPTTVPGLLATINDPATPPELKAAAERAYEQYRQQGAGSEEDAVLRRQRQNRVDEITARIAAIERTLETGWYFPKDGPAENIGTKHERKDFWPDAGNPDLIDQLNAEMTDLKGELARLQRDDGGEAAPAPSGARGAPPPAARSGSRNSSEDPLGIR